MQVLDALFRGEDAGDTSARMPTPAQDDEADTLNTLTAEE